MLKKLMLLLLMVALITSFGGCGNKSNEPPMEKIQKTLTGMDNYQALCTVTFKTQRGENTYKMLQYAKMTGEYRIEVLEPERLKDTVTVCDGKSIVQIDNRVGGKVYMAKPSEVRNLVLLNSFIKNYLQAEDTLAPVSGEVEKTTLLEAMIPGNHRWLSKQNLLVDNDSLKPLKMSVLDQEGNEMIIVQYDDFKYNVELDEKMFVIPNKQD